MCYPNQTELVKSYQMTLVDCFIGDYMYGSVTYGRHYRQGIIQHPISSINLL